MHFEFVSDSTRDEIVGYVITRHIGIIVTRVAIALSDHPMRSSGVDLLNAEGSVEASRSTSPLGTAVTLINLEDMTATLRQEPSRLIRGTE